MGYAFAGRGTRLVNGRTRFGERCKRKGASNRPTGIKNGERDRQNGEGDEVIACVRNESETRIGPGRT